MPPHRKKPRRKPRKTASRKGVSRKGVSRKRRPRRLGWRLLLATAVVGVAVLAWLIWPFWQLSGQFGTFPTQQPSRLYGRPPLLRTGDAWNARSLERLVSSGYVAVDAAEASRPGTFRQGEGWVEIFRRAFPSRDGPAGGNRLRLTLDGGRVRGLAVEGRDVDSALLDPPLVASYYGPDLEERRPFTSIDAEISEDLILSVLAIEDASFLSHVGVSVTGTLRAAWTNLVEQEVRQGGSTLTQQLVKNLFLTHERTWTRKLREALLAILLELRYDKRQIFRAYLNEIFWGRSGSVNLMGVGAASWAYFGKLPAQLTLAESALLAGMIQAPATYSPFSSPERARRRRDRVLKRLGELEWVEPNRLRQALQEDVDIRRSPLRARRTPYFADAMAEEARRRFGLGGLRDQGYVLISTLSDGDQRKAEEAVSWGVDALEEGWEKGREKSLQAALVSVDPTTGALLAYVGGRDYATSQFDRVAQARRQPGSAFKPVVYATAFAEHAATPASIFDDAPFQVELDGRLWNPQNSDGRYRGLVNARHALERSLNVPTARMALATGLGPIVDLAHAMGIRGRIAPFPALALGTMEATPLEMATVYSTLASGGLRPTLHGLEAVYDREGSRVAGEEPPPPERVLDEDVAFLVNHILMGVLDRGTGAGARRQGLEDPLAGKTGTTNDRRDSWFAGYSPARTTLVWVGYDDNSKTRLSGARAALPIWVRFTHGVRPPGGFAGFTSPPGVVGAWVDPSTGGLATERCPEAVAEFFLRDFPPVELCAEHRGRPLTQPEGIEPERRRKNPFRDILRKIRGRKKNT